MVARLRLAGIRSISLPVDITNYVMLELGQPIHGYDLDKLQRRHHRAPRARGREARRPSTARTRTLDAEDLLITDDSRPDRPRRRHGRRRRPRSATTPRDVLIEAANFDPVSIARTARRHKLPSEAAKRFERGVDPRGARPSPPRASPQLLVELAGGTADARRLAASTRRRRRSRSSCPTASSPRLIGVDYTPTRRSRDALEPIGADGRP